MMERAAALKLSTLVQKHRYEFVFVKVQNFIEVG